MPRMTVLLGLLGLSTRGEVQRALARKDRWHGLVKDVFAQYYMKFQEIAVGYMPDLPRQWSSEWENGIREELDEFRQLDLQSVAELLDTCGFGTERWERIKKAGFPSLQRLIEDEILSSNGKDDSADSGEVWMDKVEAAVGEDLQHLMAWHPNALIDLVRKIDLESGQLVLTEEELQASEVFGAMVDRLAGAELEIKKLRTAGRRALDQIRELEARNSLLGNRTRDALPAGNGGSLADFGDDSPADGDLEDGGPLSLGDPAVVEMAREIESLETQLAERDRQAARLGKQVASLEKRLAESAAQAIQGLGAAAGQVEEGEDAGDPAVVELVAEIRDLESKLKAREHTIEGLREEVEKLEARPLSDRRATDEEEAPDTAELEEEVKTLTNYLKGKEHLVENLEAEVERLRKLSERARVTKETEDVDTQRQLQQLTNDLRTREHSLETLQEKHDKLQGELDAALDASAKERANAAGDQGLARENEGLRRDLRAREETIRTLRDQVDKFENELSHAREQLFSEVQKLSALTSGDMELKPSEELAEMDAESLLGYARDVAEDLDVRRQTLDEGLEGIDSIKGSFDESRRVYEEQQHAMEEQLEQLRTQLDEFEEQQQAQAEEESSDSTGLSDEARDVIAKQREQLGLLSTRIKQLTSTNRELDQNNKKIYEDLETAVRRVIPLRRQIEELETLQEALQRYIRQEHDRTFTMSKLDQQ